ncbi:MAG: hypothetical protein WCV70_03305 [Patescibacteria group bacterium]|jgi:hypothetical protein
MAQRLGLYDLNKKLSAYKLARSVGGLNFKPSKGSGDALRGIQRGANLKKTLINIAKGKSAYTFERELKLKYGIAGSQAYKRQGIMKLIQGSKKSGLTPEQIKRNLNYSQQKDKLTEEETETHYASNVITTKSIGVSNVQKKEKDMGMGRMTRPVGYAGGQTNKPTIGINSKS